MARARSVAEWRTAVRETYGRAGRSEIAQSVPLNCCTGLSPEEAHAGRRGGSGLGCGDPLAHAWLKAGECVLDLGSGAGYDCLAAAVEVGLDGHVVGIDVTPEMVSRACRNAAEAGAPIVSFLLGDVQDLPFREETFDVVISNCAINLCPDKTRTFAECCRVLRRGGRLAISDIVAITRLPRRLEEDLALYTGCIAGAATISQLRLTLSQAGFADIRIELRTESRDLIASWAPGLGLERWIASADITATK